jgi:Transposase
MAPAQRLDDRTGLAVGKIQAVVTVEGVGLQNAGVTGHMPLGMLASRANDGAYNDDCDGPPRRRSRDRVDDLANRRGLLCIKPRGLLTPRQAAKVDALKNASADFTAMRRLAMRFRGILRSKDIQKFRVWLDDAQQSGIYAMQGFARTVRRDLDAVTNALTKGSSNGQTEGHINRPSSARCTVAQALNSYAPGCCLSTRRFSTESEADTVQNLGGLMRHGETGDGPIAQQSCDRC